MTMWYDLPPAKYAEGLRYSADRSDESAARRLSEAKAWSAGEADHFARQAKRLRAMARLCDKSTATRAGDVDFLDMHNPAQTREAEAAAVAAAMAD